MPFGGAQMDWLLLSVLLDLVSVWWAVNIVVVSCFVVAGGCGPGRGSGQWSVAVSTCPGSLFLVSCR